ncbi:uncharacterized protein LOC125752352 [Canis lupus dingo]|uniref:uncharacterized protein LOC125752352 n=1 Tax=Canis lupus dingo TaxID=286419 RepID=UPI0020C4BCEC|nr:uncharacterized protein LOC125752352 [Canis lupus dingo]
MCKSGCPCGSPSRVQVGVPVWVPLSRVQVGVPVWIPESCASRGALWIPLSHVQVGVPVWIPESCASRGARVGPSESCASRGARVDPRVVCKSGCPVDPSESCASRGARVDPRVVCKSGCPCGSPSRVQVGVPCGSPWAEGAARVVCKLPSCSEVVGSGRSGGRWSERAPEQGLCCSTYRPCQDRAVWCLTKTLRVPWCYFWLCRLVTA